MPKSAARVLGPYRNGDKWRLVVIEGPARKSLVVDSVESALAVREELAAALKKQTAPQLCELLDEYLQGLLARGVQAETVEKISRMLRGFLPVHEPVAAISAERAQQLYLTETHRKKANGQAIAADTHHLLLRRAKHFFKWAVTRRYATENPFADIHPIGRPRRGKPQLRIDEAQQFVTVGLKLFDEEGDLLALGGVMALLMGLRASEVLLRQVRDIDRGATILWIDGGKTRNARRYLDVPAVLQPRLRKLTAGRAGEELLLGQSRDGVRRDRRSLWVAVGRICRTAGVPRVCPHSLRGLWATLGVQSGAVSHAVAASLGHGSFEMTAKHYAQPEVVSGACTARMIDMLELNSGNDALVQLPAEELLLRLPQETLVKLVDLAYRTGRLLTPKDAAAEALSQSLRVESLRPRPEEKN